MTTLRLIVPTLAACALFSCASSRTDTYDTAPPQLNAPPLQPANPVYDTPAVYEETGSVAPVPNVDATGVPANPAIAPVTRPVAPVVPATSHGAAIIHVVVAGDTLSGIAAKYKVPSAMIKEANRMTTDTVVLGRKMVIPPAR